MNTGGILKNFSISKIVSGVNNTLNMVNRAIPIYKQISPTIKNVKNAFNTVSSVRNSIKEEKIKGIKSFERPVSVIKKENSSRGDLKLDTLTFFQ